MFSTRRSDGTTTYSQRDWGCLLKTIILLFAPVVLGLIVFSVSIFQSPLQLETEIAGGVVESVQTGNVIPLADRLIANSVAVVCMTAVLYFLTFLWPTPRLNRLALALVLAVVVSLASLTLLDPIIQWGFAFGGGVVHQEQVNTTSPGPSPLLRLAIVTVVTGLVIGAGALWLLHRIMSKSESNQ